MIDDLTAPGEEYPYIQFLGILEAMIKGDCSRRELREVVAYFDVRMEERVKRLCEEVGA